MIKEAAILKKHNLFEDNMALPSESVSSLTDLKAPVGSNQASPAKRASAILPGVVDNETLSNDVFQESGEKQPPEVPSPLAKEESLSYPSADGQVIISSTDDPVVNPVAAEDTAEALGTHSSGLEFGATPEHEEPAPEKPEAISASGSLKELRNLLTVTIEVPVEPATLTIEKGTNQETLVPQETEKEEETTRIYTEADQEAASSQDNCGESEVRESQAQAGGLELGGFTEVQSACGGLSEGAQGPGPTEEQAEAGEPTEGELAERASRPDAHEGGTSCAVEGEAMPQGGCLLSSDPVGGTSCPVESETMPQEGCLLSSDPVGPGESEAAVEEASGGGEGDMTEAPASVEAGKGKGPRVYECQWVVENVPDTDILGPPREDAKESSPEQPSEE